MSIDKIRKMVANATYVGQYPKGGNPPHPDVTSITVGDADRAIKQYDEANELWSELSALVCCTSPDGSAELDTVRLLLEKVQPVLWDMVRDAQPAPHARYLVRRKGVVYTATPCYGLHEPWWVVTTMTGEASPVSMLPDDEWKDTHDN